MPCCSSRPASWSVNKWIWAGPHSFWLMPLRTTAFRDFSILRSLTNWPVPAGRSTANGGIQRWPSANDRGCTLRVPVTEGWVMSGGYSGLAWSAVATLSHKHHSASGSLRSSPCCSMHAVHAVLTQVQPYLLYWDAYGSLSSIERIQ